MAQASDLEEILDTRTRRAKRQWEEAWSNPIAAKQNWQRIAFCEAAALVFAVWGLIHLGGMPKQVLYVVERDKAKGISRQLFLRLCGSAMDNFPTAQDEGLDSLKKSGVDLLFNSSDVPRDLGYAILYPFGRKLR
jgi:hypothetical protein